MSYANEFLKSRQPEVDKFFDDVSNIEKAKRDTYSKEPTVGSLDLQLAIRMEGRFRTFLEVTN